MAGHSTGRPQTPLDDAMSFEQRQEVVEELNSYLDRLERLDRRWEPICRYQGERVFRFVDKTKAYAVMEWIHSLGFSAEITYAPDRGSGRDQIVYLVRYYI